MNKANSNLPAGQAGNPKPPKNPFDVPNPEKVWKHFLKESKPVSSETIKQRVQESKQAYRKGSE